MTLLLSLAFKPAPRQQPIAQQGTAAVLALLCLVPPVDASAAHSAAQHGAACQLQCWPCLAFKKGEKLVQLYA